MLMRRKLDIYPVYNNNNNNNNSLLISFLGVGKIQWIYMKIVKKDLHENCYQITS